MNNPFENQTNESQSDLQDAWQTGESAAADEETAELDLQQIRPEMSPEQRQRVIDHIQRVLRGE